MKVWMHFCLLILMFLAGWASRGFFAEQRPVEKQIAGNSLAQPPGELIGKGTDNSPDPRLSGLPQADTVTRRQLDTADHSSISGKEHLVNEELIVSFETMLFHGRITEASRLIRQYSGQFSGKDIELLGAVFTSYALQLGLDQYQGSFELMNIEARLSSMDAHTPSSQFFDVVEQASIDPFFALSILDELSSYYQEQISEGQLRQLEAWLIGYADKTLRETKDWTGLESWYQTLISRSVDSENYHRRLAALYFDLGRNLESLEVLDHLANNFSGWSQQDEQLYQANTLAVVSDSVEAIPLRRAGEHYIVNVRMNNRINVPMLLDTGASISGLDRQFVRSQGFHPSGQTVRLSTAGGRVEADLVRLASVAFGDNQLVNLDVASIDLNTSASGSGYQGLLGMDVLGRFKFYLDQRQAILYLRPDSETGGLPPEFQ